MATSPPSRNQFGCGISYSVIEDTITHEPRVLSGFHSSDGLC
jgi:hypothetical protein